MAALLAASWPGAQRRVLVEADADGGVLAARWRTGWATTWQPGVAELVAQGRTGVDDVLEDLAQHVGGGVGLLPGLGGRRAATTVAALDDDLAAALAASPALVVADIGRVRDATQGLWRRSQAVLLVTHAGIEGVQATGPLRAELAERGARCGLVVVGDSGHSLDEYRRVVGVEDRWVWHLPTDSRAARNVAESGPAAAKVTRSRLGRAAAKVAADLSGQLAEIDEASKPWSPGLWASAPAADVGSVPFREVTTYG